MSHMIWKGAISFGLVHVPVQLYPATQSEKVGFNLLDKRSIDPIGYRQINKRTGKEVTRDNIVRGFEYEKDKYVVLSDDEIRSANPESTQTVDILAFVEAPEISFLYLDTPYFLAPDRKGEKVYALLREALKASGKIGVATALQRIEAAVRRPEESRRDPARTRHGEKTDRRHERALGAVGLSRYLPRRHHGARRSKGPGRQDGGDRRSGSAASGAPVR
jgi:Ku protein